MGRKKSLFRIGLALLLAASLYLIADRIFLAPDRVPGEVVDALDGVDVYYNGRVGHVAGRNLAPDGYNFGLKYQCVEFVKRYYYEYYNHRMPDSYGHAKDFFDPTLADGAWNERRGLLQFRNGSSLPPRKGDLLVLGPAIYNPYGHVAIVSGVGEGYIEIIQQNPGPGGKPRKRMDLENSAGGGWRLKNSRVLGWLRMK